MKTYELCKPHIKELVTLVKRAYEAADASNTDLLGAIVANLYCRICVDEKRQRFSVANATAYLEVSLMYMKEVQRDLLFSQAMMVRVRKGKAIGSKYMTNAHMTILACLSCLNEQVLHVTRLLKGDVYGFRQPTMN